MNDGVKNPGFNFTFWLPKCLPYVGLTEKVLTVAFVKCKPGLFKSFGVLIFSHFQSQIRLWIQVAGVFS